MKSRLKNKLKSKFNICNILMLIFFVTFLAIDILTKYLAEAFVDPITGANFIPGFMNFFIVHNDGAAWNLFSGFQILLIVITVIFLIVFMWFFWTKHTESKVLGVATGLIFAGCVGNLYDRIFLGFVRDFLNFQFMSFPVFNVADICICLGILLLCIYFIFLYPKDLKKEEVLYEKINLSDINEFAQQKKKKGKKNDW